jgi:hypothetical protein
MPRKPKAPAVLAIDLDPAAAAPSLSQLPCELLRQQVVDGRIESGVFQNGLKRFLLSVASAITVSMILQSGALIWWASSLNTRVLELEHAVQRNYERVEKYIDAIQKRDSRTTNHDSRAMTTPAGCLSLAQENLRVTLADAAAFRTWCGAADRAAALLRIYHEGLPAPQTGDTFTREELQQYRPYAVVFTQEQAGLTKTLDSIGTHYQFAAQGRLKVRLYQNCPAGFRDQPTSDANLEWKNTVGAIIDDLCELAGQPGYLSFDEIRIDAGPYWSHPQLVPAEGIWQGVELGMAWRGA